MEQIQSDGTVERINKLIITLRQKYSEKTIEYYEILKQQNDARVMTFNKIHNTILCYDIVWKNFLENFADDDKYSKLLYKFNLTKQPKEFKEGLPYSHNLYISFGVYIRLFCCLESSLRVIHRELAKQGYFKFQDKFVSIDTVMAQIIKHTKIDEKYKNLVTLLANVRNLMHGFGAFPYDDKPIKYNGTEYIFKKPFVSANLVRLDSLLQFFEKDVINMFEAIFNSSIIISIPFMEDDLDTNLDNYKKYMNT